MASVGISRDSNNLEDRFTLLRCSRFSVTNIGGLRFERKIGCVKHGAAVERKAKGMRATIRISAVSLVLFGTLLTATARGVEITPEGRQLKADLDAMDVEHLWLPKTQLKSWRTGEASDEPLPPGSHTHCSAFVAAFCLRHDIPMLFPPPQHLLANRQRDWLLAEGRAEGWRQVGGQDAQRLANRGVVVVASFKNNDPHFHGGHGHIALIRPSAKSAAQVAKEGPQITQSGGHNYNSAPLSKGFAQQVIDRHEVLFFAYKP
jgi:hypothetical protein